jgi:hypothetical protein
MCYVCTIIVWRQKATVPRQSSALGMISQLHVPLTLKNYGGKMNLSVINRDLSRSSPLSQTFLRQNYPCILCGAQKCQS